ncbi:probable G-protein coupled receptor B0563.6 [Saccostrea echinata]|uniref:probable G-protein coupled receptor B0563.6 n=1 Tax=Saccostrea echinata TaxID=191078 RepID=UPI002A83E927|nr:probable G-protein coupled receptor B0563.6 [Saccostrea echinata]XP_061193930.1 probable G-protein coupled receptor B0563.6 [Saccostrea echinata]
MTNITIVSAFSDNSSTVQTTDTQSIDSIIEVVCNRYIAPVICAIGIIGNIINYIVLSNRRLKKGSYMYLKALTLFDLMALLFSIPYMLLGVGSTDYFWIWYSLYIFLPMVNFFTTCSIWITVVMGIDRFFFVRNPKWSRRRNWKLKTQIKIFAVITFAVIICVPKFFCYEILEEGEITRIKDSEFRQSLFYHYMEIISTGALHFVPLFILSVVNVYLVKKLQSAANVRKLTSNINHDVELQRSQRIFTVTLVSIVILSIMFILPASIVDIFWYVDDNFPHVRSMRNISNLLLWCNLSINCFLYCIFNRQYLQVFKYVIDRGCDRVRRSPTRSTEIQMA